VSEISRDLELNYVLASGITDASQRSNSTNFQQRRSINPTASGVIIDMTNAKYDTADGIYGISDYYPFAALATGVMYVNIRENHGTQSVIVLDPSGSGVLTAQPSKFSSRANSVTSARIGTSGMYYMYVQSNGRNSAEYRIDVDVIEQ